MGGNFTSVTGTFFESYMLNISLDLGNVPSVLEDLDDQRLMQGC